MVCRYLWSRQVRARVTSAMSARRSLFTGKPREIQLITCEGIPRHIGQLLADTPGMKVFVPTQKHLLVEWGFRHPIALESCGAAFADSETVLFYGSVDLNDPRASGKTERLVVEEDAVEDTAPTTPADDTERAAAAETAPTPAAAAREDQGDTARIDAPEARDVAAGLLAALAARANAPSPTVRVHARVRPDLACHLCGERTHAEPEAAWSRCLRCDTPYHTRCWEVATGCVATGCVETRALPL
jgi:hypothetical protein